MGNPEALSEHPRLGAFARSWRAKQDNRLHKESKPRRRDTETQRKNANRFSPRLCVSASKCKFILRGRPPPANATRPRRKTLIVAHDQLRLDLINGVHCD